MSGFGSACVLGAGAIGSFLAARLSAVVPTTAIGRAPHVNAIARHGLRLTGTLDETVALDARTEMPALGPKSLLIVATKLGGLARAAEQAAERIADDTTILLIQNGIDPEREFADAIVDRGRTEIAVLRAITNAGCDMVHPGEVAYWGGGIVLPDDTSSEAVADILSRAGVLVRRDPDFARSVWRKFAVNCVANPLTAILGVENRAVTAPELAGLRGAILDEVREAARDAGVELPPDMHESVSDGLARSRNRNSMLQDIAYGRPTEIDRLNGLVVERARRAGRTAPANEAVLALVRFIENRPRRTGDFA